MMDKKKIADIKNLDIDELFDKAEKELVEKALKECELLKLEENKRDQKHSPRGTKSAVLPRQKEKKEIAAKTEESAVTDISLDPRHFLQTETMALPQVSADLVETLEDTSYQAEDQEEIIAKAFEDVDVIGDFEAEKEAVEAAENPKDIDLTLQGWGSWTGPGIIDRKKDKFIIKVPKKKRKDAGKTGLIISETVDQSIEKIQLKSVPFPYTTVEDYEAAGRIIKPLDKTVLEYESEEEKNSQTYFTYASGLVPMIFRCSRDFYNSRTRRIQLDDRIIYLFRYDGSEEGEEIISWRELKYLIAIIWIPTLLAFAFAFHLVMRNSGQKPWEADEVFSQNSTVAQKLLMILQAITKTSAMMIGEVDADNVLERKEWIPNLLLLAFEISTVILLMNLMISLAVGDVNELRQTAQEKLLDIKVNFAIESLQLSESCDCISTYINMLHRKQTNNILIINNDGTSFTTWMNIYHLQFPSGDRRMRLLKRGIVGRAVQITLDGAIIQLIESIESGIEPFKGTINGQSYTEIDEDPESYGRKFARWLIGLDWSNLLQL
ncbi:Utp14 protein [Dirofilaria immitis]|nr:Utp14 protein [Dirofilaria immitis]